MNPKTFGSNMLFQTINEDLNASLATADELSREFNSLLQECTSKVPTEAKPQKDLARSGERPQSYPALPREAVSLVGSRTPEPGLLSVDKYSTLSPASPHLLSPTQARECRLSPTNRSGSDVSFSYSQLTSPHQSPRSQRRVSPSRMMGYDSGTRGDLRPSSPASPRASLPTQPPRATLPTPPPLYDPGPRSPRMERSPSPRPFLPTASSTLPRNFVPYKPADEVVQRQKNPARWNETDLDTYERKPHNTYDKTEWLRPSVPNSSWRESNLDAAPPVSKKDPQARQLQASYASLPRNVRISGTWENPLPVLVPRSCSPYGPQPIISRISIPPSIPQPRRGRPIPLSVIMRLQNPHWALATTNYPRGLEGQEDSGSYYPQALPLPQEYLPRPPAPEQRQLGNYGEVLNSEEVDSELDRLSFAMGQATLEVAGSETGELPRPLSPTRLQPVVAPESVITEVPDRQELLRIRAEIPRALKRRGSVDQSQTLAEIPVGQRSQYKQMINKLFRRKSALLKEEPGSETGSSSESEESPGPSSPLDSPNSAPQTPVQVTPEQKGLHSILKRSSAEHKGSKRRARLSPLVMLLDGALVGELDTVQRAVQEMSDPSQANDEGITALHNAICGGHYQVVDFLVRIGADVSAPDSHGWTPLHCSASCNDKALCEFLVRNGAAVMAVTESDGATASQKCDPFAVGFEECESFLRGVEEAMGVENSGVLYGLWGYTAQAADELSFREWDMVTILQKPERGAWWWASLCGREGLVPCNYFGLFPKVRPKSLC